MDLPPFLQRQTDMIEAKDLDGVMANYHPEAIVVEPGVVFRGRDEIRSFFATYLGISPRIGKIYAAEGTKDLIVYHAQMITDHGNQESVGTLALRDGLIWRQTVLPLKES